MKLNFNIREPGTLLILWMIGYAFSLPITKGGTVFFETLLLLTWLIEGDFKRKFSVLKESLLIKTLFSILGLSVLAYFWSPDSAFWLGFMPKYYHFLILPVIYTSLRKEYVNHVVSAFLAGMLISEIISYGIFFQIWTLEGVSPTYPTPFMDHVSYSIYLVITAFILLNRTFFESRLLLKISYLTFFLTVTGNLFVNVGRTGQITYVVILLVVGLLNFKSKLKAISVMTILAVSIFTLAYNYSTNFKVRADQATTDIYRMVEYGDFTASFSGRVALWVMGSSVFKDNLAIGTGIGNETKGVAKYVKKYGFTRFEDVKENSYIDYHNAFVQYAAQLGIVGLLLFLTIFYSLFKLKFESRIYANLNIIFALTYISLSTIGFSFHLMNQIVLFVLFGGMLAAISRIETTTTQAVNK